MSDRQTPRLALQLAFSVALGDKNWLPGSNNRTEAPRTASNEPQRIVYVSYEDEPSEAIRRVQHFRNSDERQAVNETLHYLQGTESLWGPNEAGSGHTSTLGGITNAGQWLRNYCENVRAKLLVLDPLAAVYSCSENDRGLVRAFVSNWDAWGIKNDCAVLVIAHPPKQLSANAKSPDNAYSGSTDWFNASRTVWSLGLEQIGREIGKKDTPIAPLLKSEKNQYGFQFEYWLQTQNGKWATSISKEETSIAWKKSKLSMQAELQRQFEPSFNGNATHESF